MIKAVVFDLGGVYFTHGTQATAKKATKLGISKKDASDIVRGKYSQLYRKGRLTKREFWERVKKKFNIDNKTCTRLEAMWKSSFKLQNGMKNLVRKLRKKYKIILFSGIFKERYEYFEKKYKLKKEFDAFFLSFNHDFEKTENPKKSAIVLKRLMLKKMKLKPKEYVFIEDKEKLIKECRKLGINAILFMNTNQLKRDLVRLGVEI